MLGGHRPGAGDAGSHFARPELLGTKLRALYQRKKGRDLFDLWYALRHADVEVAPLLRPDIAWDFDGAVSVVPEAIIAGLPGEPWKGDGT